MQVKHVALVSLGFLILASLLVLLVAFWPGPRGMSPASTTASITSVADTEQVLKEKLENYSKRADDLQKLISLLLGLSTIYAIVLAVSAYTSVQNNLQQAEKAIDKLDASVQDKLLQADKAIERLDRLGDVQ